MTTLVHDDLVAVARDIADRELVSRAADLDAERPDVLADVWRLLVDLDLDRALLVGVDVDDFLCVLEEVAVGDAGVAVAALLNNVALASLPVEVASGLPEGARWTVALTTALDDPVSFGADSVVTGRLAGVFGAADADGIVVVTRDRLFAVPAAVAGLTLRPDPQQLGLRAARWAELCFAGVELAVDDDPRSAEVASRARRLVRCGVAAIARGIARRAYDMALAYAHTRVQGGVPIIEHGAVSDMLAAMAVRLHSLTGDRLSAAVGDPAAALACKIAASDAAMATTLDAVQVLGGVGYMVDTGVEKLMRDAKYCQLYPEPNWVARDELMRGQRLAVCNRPGRL